MDWPPAQAKFYKVALSTRIFIFSDLFSEKVGHPCFKLKQLVKFYMITNCCAHCYGLTSNQSEIDGNIILSLH